MNIQALKEMLDHSSSVNRTLGLVFVSFLIYVAVTVASTTDLMLLLPEMNINLPLVDVELPLIPFYIVMPFIVFGLHLNLLINLYEHSKKLNLWIDKNGNKPHEVNTSLHPYLFNYITPFEGWHFHYYMTRVLVHSVAFYLPMAIMLMIQLRFSDYHSVSITGLHFALFLIDSLLVFYYYPLINHKKNTQSIPLNSIEENVNDGFLNLKAFLIWLKPVGWLLCEWNKTKKAGEWLLNNKDIRRPFLRQLRMLFYFGVILYAVANLSLVNIICSENRYDWVSSLMLDGGWPYNQTVKDFIYKPRIILTEQSLVRKEPSESLRFQVLKERSIGEDSLWSLFGQGVNLSKRDLKYGDFSMSNLREVDLHESQLQYANFYQSNMRGADMRWVNLKDGNLENAELQLADLRYANMHSVYLWDAQLQGTDLSWSDLQNANLVYASLHGANLEEANLQNASLAFALLQGSFMKQVNLQGADLRNVQMQGSNLVAATLMGADLSSAGLEGAFLENADFQGANLTNAQLQGCVFQWSNLSGVHLDGAVIENADFNNSVREKLYFQIINDTIDADWEGLLNDSLSIPKGMYRSMYVKYIEQARYRRSNISLCSDLNGFLDVRKEIVCEPYYRYVTIEYDWSEINLLYDSTFIFNHDILDSINKILIDYMEKNCKDKKMLSDEERKLC